MTDLDLFKAIVRAVSGVPQEHVSEAVAKVRALFQMTQSAADTRAERGNRNRMERGGQDRSSG